MDFLRHSGRDNCADLLARVGSPIMDNEGNKRLTPTLQAQWEEIVFAMLTGGLRQPEGATRVEDIQEVLLLNPLDMRGSEEDKELQPLFAFESRGGA